jgi:membrane associated rhomboid family serine protease
LAEGRATTRQPLSGQPVVTLGIMAACVAAYAVTMLTGGATSPLHEWGAMLGRSAANSDGTVVTGVADGAWWRLVTSAFLHYPVLPFGLVHLVLNMYGLYAFGPYVESVLGRWRFALAYLTMAVGASVAVYWLANPLAPTIGASGAVFGLFGFALVMLRHEGRDISALLMLLALNAFLSLQGGISWQAHVGGLVVGLAIGAVVAAAPRRSWRIAYVAAIGSLWLVFAFIVATRTVALLA